MDVTLAQAIKGIRLYNEAAGRAKTTYRWYESNLIHIQNWLENRLGHAPHLDEATYEEYPAT